MGDIYALLVGINQYQDPRLNNLAGCVNDVRDAVAFLKQHRRPDTGLDVNELLDDEATGEAIVSGIRQHLGQAGPGDVALFWFSGHGATEPVGDFWYLESNGEELQTLVCADSRVAGRPDLLDKELAVLLGGVAERGCHVVAILDSCHSGGATRDGVTYRAADQATEKPSYRLLPDLAGHYADGPPPVRHVLMAACRPEEKAGEALAEGDVRGRFSHALLQVMAAAPAGTTYRDLVLLARNQVEQRTATQRPIVFPEGRGLADAPLFGGGAIVDPPTFTMRHGKRGWQGNAGAAHGIAAGRTRFAVEGARPALEVDVTAVETGFSLVAPLDWEPDKTTVYRLVLACPPHPVLFGIHAADTGALRAAFADDDPYVRLVGVEDAELILEPRPDGVRLLDRGNERIASLDSLHGVEHLHHIARWWRVLTLHNDDSAIAYGVLLEIVVPRPGEDRLSPQAVATPPDGDGVLRLSYADDGTPPGCFLRLRNTTGRPLHCVLLDLTERFGIDDVYLPDGLVRAGATVAVSEGEVIDVLVPEGWPTEYHDWLVLIVSTDEIDASPYRLARFDPSRFEPSRDVHPRRRRRGDSVPVEGDWWTCVLPVVTTGPRQGETR
ncbi:hypothetical protein Ait01nite_006660 [Actinoplanes italicus]|uniref:Caspase domain-containing protein n=1 Tax=Actinoplanes italicus TaxID=113567 RepID=A0A2T0KLZ5_9ACTN|nr:caspase family protein [Actinoplanes italicus]PRX24650.1 caspase domain-containing protein [Actinoplanes italicus]GIE27621.1 hypothetical protein Ait01nite_006660 [Actinoplanes italicus]